MLTRNTNPSLNASTRRPDTSGPVHPADADRTPCSALEPASKLCALVIHSVRDAERTYHPAACLAVTWGGGTRWLGGSALLMQPAL